MKKALSFFVPVLFFFSTSATTYYSINGANPNSTSSWRTGRSSGSAPSNFSTNSDIFVVQANHSMTTTANWNISGSNATLIIESGATLTADDKITVDRFQMYAGSFYIHNVANSTFPGADLRTLNATSTVEIRDWNGGAALPDPTTWGNLTLNVDNSYNSNWNMAGTLTDIAGDFKVMSTGNASKELRLATNQDYTLTIGGDFIISGGQIEAGNSNTSADQVIIINGSFNQSGGSFYRSNNNAAMEVQFNGSNSFFTKTSGTLTGTYIDWAVNSGKKLTLNDNLPISLSRTLTVTGTLDCGTNQVSGLGAFTITSVGTLITSSTSGLIGSLSLSGLLTLTTGASYEFESATTTPFPLLAGTINAKNVIIDANTTINKNVNISGTLTLTSGKLTIPTGYTINITSGNAIAGSGFSSTKHIVTQVSTLFGTKGILRMGNFSGARLFPIGNGTYYLPITLTPSGTSDFSVFAFQGATKNGTPNGTAFSAASKKTMVDALWVVSRTTGASSTNIQTAWPQALEGSDFVSYIDSQIGISSYNGTTWDNAFGFGSQASNTATRTNFLVFTPIGVGKGGIPLPIKFGEVKVSHDNGIVRVDWTSLTEDNLDHYEIERSVDGIHFNTISNVNALHNTSTVSKYTWNDLNAGNNAVLYYRIKGVDVDGKFTYSTILRISLGKASSKLSLYPNPVTGNKVSLSLDDLSKGKYEIFVYDLSGHTVYRAAFEHSGGTISKSVELPGGIDRGIYNLRISGDNFVSIKSFILQ